MMNHKFNLMNKIQDDFIFIKFVFYFLFVYIK